MNEQLMVWSVPLGTLNWKIPFLNHNKFVIPFQILSKYLALQLWRRMNVALAIETLVTRCAKAQLEEWKYVFLCF